MSDDIERAIREAVAATFSGDGPPSNFEESLIAGLVAVVRLMREPQLPKGWRLGELHWHHRHDGLVRHYPPDTYEAWLRGDILGNFRSLAEAIAAVEKERGHGR